MDTIHCFLFSLLLYVHGNNNRRGHDFKKGMRNMGEAGGEVRKKLSKYCLLYEILRFFFKHRVIFGGTIKTGKKIGVHN